MTRMTGLRLREGLRPGDLAGLSALTATCATAVLGADRLGDLLLAGRAEDTVVIIAETEAGTAGYVHLEIASGGGEAWLVSGAVDPSQRRRGIGATLLYAAADAAHQRGAGTLRISGRPHGYAAPGVDAEADPATAAFLEAHGARPAGSALSMHRTLHDLAPRSAASATDIRPCTVEDVAPLLTLVREHLTEDMAGPLERYAAGGGELDRILLARTGSGELLGFACWGVVGTDPSRFGPFGIVPAARGRGTGGALLDAALHRMAGEGLAHAWFQWTGPGTPAHRLYAARGFTPLRTYTPYTLAVVGQRAGFGHQEGRHR